MTQRNESSDLISGITLLLGAHILAFIVGGLTTQLIFTIANALPASFNKALNSLTIPLVYAVAGFGIAQLAYVIPLVIYLKRRRRYELWRLLVTLAIE